MPGQVHWANGTLDGKGSVMPSIHSSGKEVGVERQIDLGQVLLLHQQCDFVNSLNLCFLIRENGGVARDDLQELVTLDYLQVPGPGPIISNGSHHDGFTWLPSFPVPIPWPACCPHCTPIVPHFVPLLAQVPSLECLFIVPKALRKFIL